MRYQYLKQNRRRFPRRSYPAQQMCLLLFRQCRRCLLWESFYFRSLIQRYTAPSTNSASRRVHGKRHWGVVAGLNYCSAIGDGHNHEIKLSSYTVRVTYPGRRPWAYMADSGGRKVEKRVGIGRHPLAARGQHAKSGAPQPCSMGPRSPVRGAGDTTRGVHPALPGGVPVRGGGATRVGANRSSTYTTLYV